LGKKLIDSLLIHSFPYSILRADRNSRKGGGVCLFVSNLLNFTKISNISIHKADIVCTDIFDPVTLNTFRLINIYSPPNFKDIENYSNFLNYITELVNVQHSSIIVGDFNLPKILFDNFSPSISTPTIEKLFLEFTEANNLEQLIHFETRKNHTLDLLLTNEKSLISDINCLPPFGTTEKKSDHNSFCFKILHSKTPKTTINRKNFHKANYIEINNFLYSIDWLTLFKNCKFETGANSARNYLNSIYSLFCKVIDYVIEQFVPNSTISNYPFPRHIRSLIHYRFKLWKTQPMDNEKFIICSKKIDFEINRFLKNRENNKIKNLKTRYKFIGSFLKTKTQLIPSLKYDNVSIFNDTKKSEVIAKTFQTIFNHEDYTTNDIFDSKNHIPTLSFIPIEKDIIFLLLKKCRQICNTSPDSIPEIFLQKCAESLTVPIYHIFSYSVMISSIPSIWKKSIITPIPKTKNTSNPYDYRPISQLCTTSKILEKIIFFQISKFFEDNKIIPECQHGFRKQKSIVTQLIEVHDDLSKAHENKNITDLILFDLSKAFDSIPHSRLIKKLNNFGIRGPLLEWIRDYLSNRKYSVKVGSKLSNEKSIPSGIPQGSIGGPILFIIYISDLIEFCKTENVVIKLFADDLKIYHTSNSTTEFNLPLQNFITKFTKYCSMNGLKIASEKCNVLHLGGRRNPKLPYFLFNSPIPTTEDQPVRDLGLYYSSNLKYHHHVDNIAKKARRISFALLKSIRSRNSDILIQIFKIYVRPVLEFCSNVFNPYLLKDINAIEKIQKFYLKIVYKRANYKIFKSNEQADTPTYKELLSLYHLESLELRRLKTDLNMFHKILHGHVKINSNNSYICLPSKTRGDPFKIISPAVVTPIRFNSFFVRTSRIYSDLPSILRQNDINQFETNLKIHCFTKYLKYNL